MGVKIFFFFFPKLYHIYQHFSAVLSVYQSLGLKRGGREVGRRGSHQVPPWICRQPRPGMAQETPKNIFSQVCIYLTSFFFGSPRRGGEKMGFLLLLLKKKKSSFPPHLPRCFHSFLLSPQPPVLLPFATMAKFSPSFHNQLPLCHHPPSFPKNNGEGGERYFI